MMNFHANILKKNGEKEFVVIPYEVFVKIQEELDDYESLKALREAKSKEANAKTTPFDDVKKELKIK
jgi:PHD/YefM family antitoxin component YafN of YafNO toxin-antitoxin module